MQLALISTSVTKATQWDAGTNRTAEWKDYTVAEPRGSLKNSDMQFWVLGSVVLGAGSGISGSGFLVPIAMRAKNRTTEPRTEPRTSTQNPRTSTQNPEPRTLKQVPYCGRLNIPTITALPMT